MKTTVLLVIDHKRPIPDLLKLVEGRVYNLDAVEDCNASVAETPAQAAPQTALREMVVPKSIYNAFRGKEQEAWLHGYRTAFERYATPQPPAPAVPLTDAQCDEFRRFNGGFNEMVRAIYESGKAGRA